MQQWWRRNAGEFYGGYFYASWLRRLRCQIRLLVDCFSPARHSALLGTTEITGRRRIPSWRRNANYAARMIVQHPTESVDAAIFEDRATFFFAWWSTTPLMEIVGQCCRTYMYGQSSPIVERHYASSTTRTTQISRRRTTTQLVRVLWTLHMNPHDLDRFSIRRAGNLSGGGFIPMTNVPEIGAETRSRKLVPQTIQEAQLLLG